MRKISKRISITIGRFGHTPENIEAKQDSTVGEVLEEAAIDLNSNETVWVNGEKALKEDILDDKDVVNIVTPKQGGC